MKLKQLNLIRYGHFEDKSVVLNDKKITVIYGPNETGKSTSLAAIGDLFYGIDRSTGYGFLHEGKNMRIGGQVENRGGMSLSFFRRKGNSKTLLAEDGVTVLDDSALDAFLGRTEKSFFQSTFGLSHREMRRGGEEIVTVNGDAGKVFLQAGSGIQSLTKIQTALDERASDLFAPTKSKNRRIYQTLETYDAATKSYRDSMLKSSDYEAAIKAVEQAEKKFNDIRNEHLEKEEEKNRYSRLQSVLPILHELSALREKLKQLGTPSNLPADAESRYSAANQAKNHSERIIGQTENEIAAKQKEFDECQPNDSVLRSAGEIEALNKQVGEVRSALNTLPKTQSELDHLIAMVNEEAMRFDLPCDESGPVMPNDITITALEDLLKEIKETQQAVRQIEEQRAAALSDVHKQETELKRYKNIDDPSPTSTGLQKVVTDWKSLADEEELEKSINRLSKSIETSLARLSWWTGTAQELQLVPFPMEATIEKYEQGISQAKKKIAGIEDKLSNQQIVIYETKSDLDSFRTSKQYYSLEDVGNARDKRDKVWKFIEQSLNGAKAPDSEVIEAFGEGSKLDESFERLMHRADKVVDGRFDSIGKEVELESLKRNLTKQESHASKLQENLAEELSALEEMENRWKREWVESGITPLTPKEMLEGLRVVGALAEKSEQLDELQEKLSAVKTITSDIVKKLIKISEELDCQADFQTASIDEVINDVEKILNERAGIYKKISKHKTLHTAAVDKADDLEKKHSDIRLDLGSLEDRWKKDRHNTGSEAELTVKQGFDLVECCQRLRVKLTDIRRLKFDLELKENLLKSFSESVHTLQSLETEQSENVIDAHSAIFVLQDISVRLQAEQELKVRRQGLSQALEERNNALSGYRVQFDNAVEDIRLLMGSAKVEDEKDLPAAIETMKNYQTVKSAIADAERQLSQVSNGDSEDKLREETENLSGDSLNAFLTDLTEQLKAISIRRDEAVREETSARNNLYEIEKSGKSQEFAQEMQLAVSSLKEDSRDYLRLKMASLLLQKSIGRMRERYQSPVLRSASGYFRRLTLNSFDSVAIEYDDKDVPRIVGVRGENDLLDVAGMSVGTCDQLYLALRLAFLTNYCEKNESLPFVGDDLFVHFDDERTTAALELLADLPDIQIILFTHHPHLVALAKKALADQVNVIDLSA